jgi:hypothetical protein
LYWRMSQARPMSLWTATAWWPSSPWRLAISGGAYRGEHH